MLDAWEYEFFMKTIVQKMADWGRSDDLHVVHIHKSASSSFSEPVDVISKSYDLK